MIRYLIFILLLGMGGHSIAYDVYDIPIHDECDTTIVRVGVITCYNHERKSPLWVMVTITSEDLSKVAITKKRPSFRIDRVIPRKHRNLSSIYRGSLHDRGHLLGADDVNHNLKLHTNSYLYSNIVPIVPSLNRGLYRRIENVTRSMMIAGNGRSVLIVGAIYGDRKFNNLHIPDKLYRIIILPAGEVYAYLIPNIRPSDNRTVSYLVDIDKITKLTGFDFNPH